MLGQLQGSCSQRSSGNVTVVLGRQSRGLSLKSYLKMAGTFLEVLDSVAGGFERTLALRPK